MPLKTGKFPPRSHSREGEHDGLDNHVRRSDQSLAESWQHIKVRQREPDRQASQSPALAASPPVQQSRLSQRMQEWGNNQHLRQMRLRREDMTLHATNFQGESDSQAGQSPDLAAFPPVQQSKLFRRKEQPRNNEHLRQMRLRREEMSKDGRYVGLSSRAQRASEGELSPHQETAIPSPINPPPPSNGESPPQGPNIIWVESDGANYPNHPRGIETQYATPVPPPPESSESALPQSESAGWTRWTSLESKKQPRQREAPSITENIQSAPRDIERVKEEDLTRNRSRRRAEKFVMEPPIQSVKYESHRLDRERQNRRRQAVPEYDEEEEEDYVVTRTQRKQQRKKDKAMQRAAAPPIPIILPEFISIANLAGAVRVRMEDFTRKMEVLGFEETSHDHVLDAETAGLIVTEFNFEPIVDRSGSEDLQARGPAEDKSVLPARPPVVTIMGHVDHGKTTLLDWLRKSSVAASEHGGITQHIGAFSVPMPSGRIITFLDTPGHAAFLSMRQRGANVTDIVILVVAADDSVKPQTIEAINHAKAAKVPMIVAINKIDKEDANVDRVKLDLGRHGVDVEDFGGDTQVVCVSGKTGQGMDELEDAAGALADILDMRAETDGAVEGWVLETTTKKAGRVATVLVRRGTMRPGNVIVAGSTWARVRSLRNEAGVQVVSAGPGTPVEVDGWRDQPAAGDEVLQASDEQKAKSVVSLRLELAQHIQMATDVAAVNEARRLEQEKREQEKREQERQEQEKRARESETVPSTTSVDGRVAPKAVEAASMGVTEVFFIVKADVSGSVEAVLNSITALGNAEVRAHVLRSGVGPVGEFDVEHAAVAHGYIVAFNTPVDVNISRMAEAAGVPILESNIIYRLIDDVKHKLEERLPPLTTKKVIGEAEVAQVFDINVKRRGTLPVAGCRVRNGVVMRSGKVRVLRDKDIIYDGMLSQSSPPLPLLASPSRTLFLLLTLPKSTAPFLRSRLLCPTSPLLHHS